MSKHLAAMVAALTLVSIFGCSIDGNALPLPKLKAEKIVISKKSFLLTVYGADSVVITRYPVAVGANPGNKQREGD